MEQKYNKYIEKLNKYIQMEGMFKIGEEIILKNDNIPGVVMNFQKPNIYSIRLVGMDYNIDKINTDINVNSRTDTPEFPFIDGRFNFNYPEFHSYSNVDTPTTYYDNRFNNYIIANINNFPSQQFLRFVNTNIFLYYYIINNFYDILNTSKHIIVDDKNKVLKSKSVPLSLYAEEFKPKSKLSASSIEFNPTNLINSEDIGKININKEESINYADQKILDLAATETANQETDEDAFKYALRESILSNYRGKRLEYFSKLSFENLEKEHKQYLSSVGGNKPPTYLKQIKKHGQVLNPEEYDTDN
jgi:hypothetical protein